MNPTLCALAFVFLPLWRVWLADFPFAADEPNLTKEQIKQFLAHRQDCRQSAGLERHHRHLAAYAIRRHDYPRCLFPAY